jgi:hypothetical protein
VILFNKSRFPKKLDPRDRSRVNIDIISDFFFSPKNSGNSDRTAGLSLLFLRSNRRKPRISAADEVPLAVNFWKNSEKQRELTQALPHWPPMLLNLLFVSEH